MELIVFILTLILIIYIYRLLRRIVKRTVAIARLRALARGNEKIKLKFTRSPLLSFFKMSHAPDLTIEIGNKIFLVRFYNGRGSRTQVHFANAEYSAVFSVLMVRSFGGLSRPIANLGGSGGRSQSTTSIFKKVNIIPELDRSKYAEDVLRGRELVPVFVFNPAPTNVSYVSEEKTSIKLAFTGDRFLDTMIFTGSTFATYIEREARRQEGYDGQIIFHTELE